MLKIGDRITCGDKEARKYCYQSCVGKQGEILGGPYRHNSMVEYTAKFDNTYGEWSISGVDCLPISLDTNRSASILLEEDY